VSIWTSGWGRQERNGSQVPLKEQEAFKAEAVRIINSGAQTAILGLCEHVYLYRVEVYLGR